MKSEFFSLQDYLKVSFVSMIFVQTCLAVTCTALALTHDHDDCDQPVRLLIVANTAVLACNFLASLWFRKAGFVVWVTWNVVFLILAVCWTFASSDCEDDFTFGYAVTAVMAVVSIAMVTLVLLGLCIGGLALCIGYGLMDKYENFE